MRHNKVVERLLNSSSPSIRYRMQRDFQDREPDSDLKERILVSQPVKKIFKKMHTDGYWLYKGTGDGIDYSMSSSTHFVLAYLAELGLGNWDERIDLAVKRYMGLKEAGKYLSPPDYLTGQSCLYAYNIRTFIMLGYKNDIHMKARISALLDGVRHDNGYLCDRKTFKDSTKSCIRGSLKALMAYSELPDLWTYKSCKKTVDYFTSRNIYYKKPDLTEKIRGGMKTVFPFVIGESLLEPLYALSKMGYGRKNALGDAWKTLEEHRTKDGLYRLDWHPNAIFKPGEKGEGNEWVTFYALMAFKYAGKLKL